MEQEKHASEGKKGPHEDCVEECEFILFHLLSLISCGVSWSESGTLIVGWVCLLVFHLTHCATQCAAPKLFAQLK